MKNVQIDSRRIQPGDIFLAISCGSTKKNINDALQNGAEIVFAEKTSEGLSKDEKIFIVDDIRLLASKFAKFKFPKQPKNCACVTGTNGKSSIAHFVNQIWFQNDIKSANLGTLGLFIKDERVEDCGFKIPNLTTPGPFELHQICNYLAEQEIENLVFEASSHAIDQKRLYSVDLKAAAFSNFASDHLDYHKTKKQYFGAKLKLFSEVLGQDKPAIIPGDSELIFESVRSIHRKVITFGFSEKNDIVATNIKEFENKIIFDCSIFGNVFNDLTLNLFGSFQVSNILCAIGIACASGLNIEKIIDVLPTIKPLDGRMEYIATHNGGHIYVDFAHTTEGFKNALDNFKKVCKGRLICIFGCGGDRDKSKRAEMGKIADVMADISVITDDNPRMEDPARIRRQIMSGCKNAVEIGNRKEAIQYGINLLEPGDFLIVLGKGHETVQIYKDKILQFNDKKEILKII